MRRKESASAARVSHTCHGSRIKSFRKIGIFVTRLASFKSASEPEKKSSSVSTESAAAPAFSKPAANKAGRKFARITPRDGEAFFISAIMRRPVPVRAEAKSRGG